MEGLVQGGGEDPVVQGMQGDQSQRKVEGQFGDSFVSPRTLSDITRTQLDLTASVLGIPTEDRMVEQASHFPGNSDVPGRLRTSATWILNKLVAFGWVSEQLTKNFLVRFLVAVKYNLDRSEVALLQTLVNRGKISGLDPSHFSEDDKKALDEARQSYQIFESGIRKAFGGTTNGIKLWYKLRDMPLREARGIWQTIANEIAVDCFGEDGDVDVEKLRGWMEFLGNAKNFEGSPFCYIPCTELTRSQMYGVCKHLLANQNGARDLLNVVNGIPIRPYGDTILATMSQGKKPPLKPGEAILASLFSPYRQMNLGTCATNAFLNAENHNHPERLIKIFALMLSSGQIIFPSGYVGQLQPIEDGFITVDLTNGGEGRDKIFEDIMDGDPAKIAWKIGWWKEQEGIEYSGLVDPAEKYKLRMPVHNLNDILFSNFLQAANYGNKKIDISSDYGITQIYIGNSVYGRAYLSETLVDSSNFLDDIAKLKEQAEAQQRLGHHCMRVATRSSSSAHMENIDIAALLAFDPNNMEAGKAYPIGDRNWYDDMSQDIPRLAVRKVNGTPPTYEWGTLWESDFHKEDISEINVCAYATDIRGRDARYWAQFMP
ncbi:MAG: hypothetical protein LBE98_04570 [Puniceicoccales bacterium]|jgi:hypothetical protein|nr:hypothetical protein [Puniceicoccales bacterium]